MEGVGVLTTEINRVELQRAHSGTVFVLIRLVIRLGKTKAASHQRAGSNIPGPLQTSPRRLACPGSGRLGVRCNRGSIRGSRETDGDRRQRHAAGTDEQRTLHTIENVQHSPKEHRLGRLVLKFGVHNQLAMSGSRTWHAGKRTRQAFEIVSYYLGFASSEQRGHGGLLAGQVAGGHVTRCNHPQLKFTLSQPQQPFYLPTLYILSCRMICKKDANLPKKKIEIRFGKK